MIEYLYTVSACRAVACSLGTKDMTCPAESASWRSSNSLSCGNRHIQEIWIFLGTKLKEWASRDDARISAGSEVEKEVHECDANQIDNWQCGVNYPILSDYKHAEGDSDAKRAAIDIEHARYFLEWTSDTAATEEAIMWRVDLVYFWHKLFNYDCLDSLIHPNTHPIIFHMHRRRQNKVKSYFEITEDPPQPLPALRNTNRAFNNYKLPVNKGFFFIDFTEGRQLCTQDASCVCWRSERLKIMVSHLSCNVSDRMWLLMYRTPLSRRIGWSSTRNSIAVSGTRR